jgi:hypothetical protein
VWGGHSCPPKACCEYPVEGSRVPQGFLARDNIRLTRVSAPHKQQEAPPRFVTPLFLAVTPKMGEVRPIRLLRRFDLLIGKFCRLFKDFDKHSSR